MPPLQGTLIVDLTRYLPGPYATLLLAEAGARVIKVEPPGTGDLLRVIPPYAPNGMGASFAALNRGKESVTLDLKDEEARGALVRLCERADVVVDGFRPGVLDRLGCGFELLGRANPRLVRCALTGFGLDGPYAQRAGHDLTYMAYSGALALGRPPTHGQAGSPPPAFPGVQVADLAGGLFAALGIVLALRERDRTGRGAVVDAALADAAASFASTAAAAAQAGSPPRAGEAALFGGAPCYNLYECADGRWLAVGAIEPKFWERLVSALGLPELAPFQFAAGDEAAPAFEALRRAFRARPRDDWVALLDPLDCCVAPVLEIDEAIRNEHARHRAIFFDAGGLPGIQGGVRVAGAAPPALSPPPALGHHTHDVLREFGYTDASIEAMRARGAA